MIENTVAILVSWNSSSDLQSLIPVLVENDDFQKIVIVDNGSTDNSISVIKELEKKYSTIVFIDNEKNLGFSSGVNRGIQYALEQNMDAFCLLNCDIQIQDNTISNLKDFLNKYNEYGAVSSVILNPDSSIQVYGGGKVNWLLGTSASYKAPVSDSNFDYLSGACMLVRTSVIQKIGLFDEERFFMYWEDVDFGVRIKKAGWKLGVCKESTLTHEMSKSLGRFGVIKDYYTIVSLKAFFKKHKGIQGIFISHIAITLKLIKRLLALRFKNVLYILKGYLGHEIK
jgi:GT2 family glycosyltransferase